MNFGFLAANHKAIGGQYLWAGLFSLLLGISLTVLLRSRFSSSVDDIQPSEFTDYLVAAHGTIIVFFGIVPVMFSAFGNYIMPLEGETEMTFPRLNLAGVILFYLSLIFLMISLFTLDKRIWILAMALNIPSALFCGLTFVATIARLRNNGLRWMQMRFVVWTLFITALLVLLTFLPLEAAAIMQFWDSLWISLSWKDSVRSISDIPIPTLWKHALWFLGHPEVYILLLFIMGVMAEGLRVVCKKGFFTG